MLVDSFQRQLTYLRLSLTDRCNLRCRYCMPFEGVPKLSHEEILSYEEFLRVVRAAASEGMTKVRLTGGEPLVRKGVMAFIASLTQIPGVMDLRLTTNGVLMADRAVELRRAGIKRVNISLDSLEPDNFRLITGRDYFHEVWNGIETALKVGFDRVKINCVAIRGVNDHELKDFALLSQKMPVEVRFIEFMPLKGDTYWSRDKMISTGEIKNILSELGPLNPVLPGGNEGPAAVYQLGKGPGYIGFISPVTDHFCQTCNRLRLTADGKLRLCLLSNKEIDLKTPIRNGATEEELAAMLREAVKAKPGRHHLDEEATAGSNRTMNLIGG